MVYVGRAEITKLTRVNLPANEREEAFLEFSHETTLSRVALLVDLVVLLRSKGTLRYFLRLSIQEKLNSLLISSLTT